MKEFFPTDSQQADLTAQMQKLTKTYFVRSVLFIIVGGLFLGVFGFLLAYVERSADGGIDPAGWLVLVGFLVIAGLSAVSVLFGFWLIIHGIYSKIRGFENYRYYIVTVIDRKVHIKKAPPGRPDSYLHYMKFINMKGKEKRMQIEEDFYHGIKKGGKIIMAKSRGGTLLLKVPPESDDQ